MAQRDMTARQFREALKRNGFRCDVLWISDTTGQVPNHMWSMLFYKGGKLARRATIAHAIRSRNATVAAQKK